MRALIAVLLIIYLVGIGVVLSPTIQAKWNSGTASELFASVMQELPRAAAWPATVYHETVDKPATQP
jgi:hypothetical protein